MQAKFSQQTTTFKKLWQVYFDDLVRKFSTEEVTVFSGKLDATEETNATIDPKIQGSTWNVESVVYQSVWRSGDFSTDVIATTYSPYPTYVGIKSPEPKIRNAETRTTNQFDVVTVDERKTKVG
jgi:hypothetical protein